MQHIKTSLALVVATTFLTACGSSGSPTTPVTTTPVTTTPVTTTPVTTTPVTTTPVTVPQPLFGDVVTIDYPYTQTALLPCDRPVSFNINVGQFDGVGGLDFMLPYNCFMQDVLDLPDDTPAPSTFVTFTNTDNEYYPANFELYGTDTVVTSSSLFTAAVIDVNKDGLDDILIDRHNEDGRAYTDSIFAKPLAIVSNTLGQFDISEFGIGMWGPGPIILNGTDYLAQGAVVVDGEWDTMAYRYTAEGFVDVEQTDYVGIPQGQRLFGVSDDIIVTGNDTSDSNGVVAHVKQANGEWTQTNSIDWSVDFRVPFEWWNGAIDEVGVKAITFDGVRYVQPHFDTFCAINEYYSDGSHLLALGLVGNTWRDREVEEGDRLVESSDNTYTHRKVIFMKVNKDGITQVDSLIEEEETVQSAPNLFCEDVNGDGVTDIWMNPNSTYNPAFQREAQGRPIIYLADNGMFKRYDEQNMPGHSNENFVGKAHLADFNQDGITDVLYVGKEPQEGNIEMYYGNRHISLEDNNE